MAWRCSGSTNEGLIENLETAKIIQSTIVSQAMRSVDRANFCSAEPYTDAPQPIGYGVTISAPHMHAYALESLSPYLTSSSRVLDVGSGSGYLVAVLHEMIKLREGPHVTPSVVGIDHLSGLTQLSEANLQKGGQSALKNGEIEIVLGDGRLGYPEQAPYNVIHVGAASPTIPQELIDQLASPGRMFCPVGTDSQEILQIDKADNGTVTMTSLMPVRYVPLCDAEDQW